MNLVSQLDALISDLEEKGFVVILKWDGERQKKKKTVLIMRSDLDDVVRIDADDMETGVLQAFEMLEKRGHI